MRILFLMVACISLSFGLGSTSAVAAPSSSQICKKMISDGRGGGMNQADCMCVYRVADAILDDDLKALLFDSWYNGTDNMAAMEKLPNPRRVDKQLRTMKRSIVPNCGQVSFGGNKPSSSAPSVASKATMATARKAADLCLRYAPDWQSYAAAMRSIGFRATTHQKLAKLQKRSQSVFLESKDGSVHIQIGSRGAEGACLIGAPGMTAQQSYALALPWAQKLKAKTNAEVGDGLAKNAVQAWRSFDGNRRTYMAAYKTWEVLDIIEQPGAAARLLINGR